MSYEENHEYIKERLDDLDEKVDDLIELAEPTTYDTGCFDDWKGW